MVTVPAERQGGRDESDRRFRPLAFLGAALVALFVLRPFRGRKGGATSAAAADAVEHNPGGDAEHPGEIPLSGWKEVLWRTYAQISKDRLDLLAAGVTFYALLALFPALAAIVSIYGLFAEPATVIDHVDQLSGVLPQSALELISMQLERVTAQPQAALGVGFAVSLALSVWGANKATKSLFSALNAAYGEEEKRGFFRLNLVSLAYTFGAILLVLLALGFIVVTPIVIAYLGTGELTGTGLALLRWPVLLVLVLLAIAVLYRYGPSRTTAKWRWVTPGSVLTSIVWLAASILFSWYVANFGGYNETYGTLGAVVIFMTWFWISTTVLLIGAELNAEAERQTARDSTVESARPAGARGAVAADTLAGQGES